mgnify:CR=1 FL=1
MQLRNKTVSVIGGSGFIGRALVEKLARAGARVTVLTRNTVRSKNLKPLGLISVSRTGAVAMTRGAEIFN